MTAEPRELKKQSDEIYQQYGKPLERDHWGRYVAIFPDGRTIMGDTLHGVTEEAITTFGRGSFFFKIGPRAVGKIR